MAPEGTQLKSGREEQGLLAQAPDRGGSSETVQTGKLCHSNASIPLSELLTLGLGPIYYPGADAQ